MTEPDRLHHIDKESLDQENYFVSLLERAANIGLLSDAEIENIQLQCIELLAEKTRQYTGGESDSVSIETAECIMKSNLFTLGIFFKSLPDADTAVELLQTSELSELYRKGRKKIEAKMKTAHAFYRMALDSNLETQNHAYRSTLDKNGIGIFFQAYRPDFEAHKIPVSIDYPLCLSAEGETGVEYIQKYLQRLCLENEFCRHFASDDIHHLLCGFNKNYRDLLINIFEQVFTAALGLALVHGSIQSLNLSGEARTKLIHDLSLLEEKSLSSAFKSAADSVLITLGIGSASVRRYVFACLPNIQSEITCAIQTNHLEQVFVSPVTIGQDDEIRFLPGEKMNDDDYRRLIDELLECRYSYDKLTLIGRKVKSFADFEEVLSDAMLNEKEVMSAFHLLGDTELAALTKKHPPENDMNPVEDQTILHCLARYLNTLPAERKAGILAISDRLTEDF